MRLVIVCLAVIGLAAAGSVRFRDGTESLSDLKKRISSSARDHIQRKSGNAVPFQEKNAKMEPIELCYGVIGCIVIDDSWYEPVNRPVNLEPMSREEINTRFILHTREAPSQDTMLYAEDLDTIRNSHFNPKRPTQFLVHGFIDDGSVRWMKRLTDNLLDYGDYNVIIVNWGQGSLPSGHPLYSQATANTRVVGLEIAYMVNVMIDQFGVNPADVHLIGHSLGAHTVGYAGEGIEKLGRITGLDPAEPYFQYMPEHVRLDPTDAEFVDVVHTDTKTILLLGYGMLQPVGHLDFYVNGGRDQPGCNPVDIALDAITEDMITAGRELAACNHLRSIEFFIDSLVPGLNYVGYECPDYDAFKRGECFSCGADNTRCARFGLESFQYPTRQRTLVNLYFQTGKDAPYLKYHYSVKVNLAKPKEAEDFVWGEMKLSLYGTKNQFESQSLMTSSMKLMHGQAHFFLHVQDEDIGRIQRMELHWDYDSSIFDPGSLCGLFCNDHLYVSSIEVSEMNYYPEQSRLENTFKACSLTGDYADINSGRTAEFYPTACA